MMNSRFREVLLLDADNVVTLDPTFLFETAEYRKTGAIFWPDYGRLGPDRAIWELTGVSYRDVPEFETGQILLDKNRTWAALELTMWMNEYSDFWYRYIHGDKETFHLSWLKLDQPYSMPQREIHPLSGTMCQHDFEGRRLFQHRNLLKWSLFAANPTVRGFHFEQECLFYLASLRPYLAALLGSPADLDSIIAGRRADYQRIGHDRRIITFESGGLIGTGCAAMERHWSMRSDGKELLLEIFGDHGLTARCVRDARDENTWLGAWKVNERMPIVVRFLDAGD